MKWDQLGSVGFFMQMGVSTDFDSVFREMLASNVCANNSSLYVWSACFFESKGRLRDALAVYQLGICRSVLLDKIFLPASFDIANCSIRNCLEKEFEFPKLQS